MEKRIKIYGFINLTKQQYLIGQTASFSLALFFWAWAIFGNFNDLFFGYGTLLLVVFTFADLIETYVVLQKFKEK